MKRPITTSASRLGYSSIELAFSTAIFVVVLLSSLAMVQRDTSLSQATLGISTVENLAQQMLFDIEHELSSSRGRAARATVAGGAFGVGETTLTVSTTAGFPPTGTLLIYQPDGEFERLDYTGINSIDDALQQFTGLDRAQDCTEELNHAESAPVFWAGLAEVTVQDPPPPATEFDGTAMELSGPTFFRGDGTGFSYRLPVDPTGGTNYMNGDDVNWGADLVGSDPTDCRVALVWVPVNELREDATGDDINGDGDRVDVFDVGQIRRQVWDVTNPGGPITDIGMGPTAILQEQCNYGGDLDGDGFDDPMFLWDGDMQRLHVRLRLVGTTVKNIPLVRTVESVMFLRNDPEL